MKTYNKNNFHKHTFCIFTEVSASEILDLKLNYISKSGSEYCFTKNGVFRKSNHWGRAANCKWRLKNNDLEENSRTKVGYANWNEFHSIDEITKLYFIQVDFNKNTTNYFHKNLSESNEVYLRNATETTKRIKEIRNLLSNPKKLEYWEVKEDFESLLIKVINLMIITDYNLLEIKHKIFS